MLEEMKKKVTIYLTGDKHQDEIILDSGMSIYIFNDLSYFTDFRKASRGDWIQATGSEIPILGYGNVDLYIWKPNGFQGLLRLKDVAFCTDFSANLVAFWLLRKQGFRCPSICRRL